MDFPIHTIISAPQDSKDALQAVESRYGFIPNLFGLLAESPASLRGYLDLAETFGVGDMTQVEQQMVLLATSLENGCEYCLAAHTMAAKMSRVPETVLRALREGAPLPDMRLDALVRFTSAVVRRRGWVSDEQVAAFLDAGYERRHILEVLLGVALKTLSNYVNHLIDTPIDEAFRDLQWDRGADAHVEGPACCSI